MSAPKTYDGAKRDLKHRLPGSALNQCAVPGRASPRTQSALVSAAKEAETRLRVGVCLEMLIPSVHLEVLPTSADSDLDSIAIDPNSESASSDVESMRDDPTPGKTSWDLAPDAAFDEIVEAMLCGREPDLEAMSAGDEELRRGLEEALRLAQEVLPRAAPGLPSIAGYRLLSEIGSGGMGVVYLAEQRELHDRLVALKVLTLPGSSSNRARSRFLREAQALALVRHPHVVRIYEVIDSATSCAYAMEWIEGSTLARLVERLATEDRSTVHCIERILGHPMADRALSVRDYWLRVGIELCDALSAVHTAGIVHRDLKPSNVLLDSQGRSYLADFGLVRLPDASLGTSVERFVGTPAFASPEQLANRSVDGRSDIFSLGATLACAVALRLPSVGTGDPRGDALWDVRKDSVLRSVFAKAMATDPDERYESPAALREDLVRVRAGMRSQATRDPWLARWRRETPARVRSRISVALALSLTAFIGLTALFTFGPQPDQPLRLVERPDWSPERSLQPESTSSLISTTVSGVDDVLTLGVADVDGDGTVDLLVGRLGKTLEIYFGRGEGRFEENPTVSEIVECFCMAIADVDGDGDADIAVGRDDRFNEIWRNDGSAQFELAGTFGSSRRTNALAFADLDGDGDTDLIEANLMRNLALENDGTGRFTVSEVWLGDGSSCVATEDLDNDGRVDLILPSSGHGLIFWNQGGWTFEGAGPVGACRSVSVGRFESGRHLGIVITPIGKRPQVVTLSGRELAIGFPYDRSSDLVETRAWTSDLDGDGTDDLVEFRAGSVGRALRGDPAGTFLHHWHTFPCGNSRVVHVADLDGDGGEEIITAGADAPLQIHTFDRQRGWFSSVVLSSCVVGDISGDGIPDLIGPATDGRITRVLGSRTLALGGVFGEVARLPPGSYFRCAPVTGDLDADGLPDLIVGVSGIAGGAPDRIYFNDGGGAFVDSGLQLGAEDTRAVVLIDIDQDGDLDSVHGALFDQGRTWINEGGRQFREGPRFGERAGTVGLLRCDADRDGIDDIFEITDTTSVLWLGRGGGEFERGPLHRSMDSATGMIGDLLGEGLEYVIEVDAGRPRAEIRALAGDLRVVIEYGMARAAALVDVCGDSRPDLILAGSQSSPILFLRNAGQGNFVPERFDDPLQLPVYSVHPADLDGDGDQDLVVLHGPFGWRVFENRR